MSKKLTPAMAKNIQLWPIERLHPYTRNARTHSPEQVAQLAASITEFGFTQPILVDGEDTIIAGHGRLMAAKELQLTEVPVVVLTHLTPAQKKAYIIADNQLATLAGWDEKMLAAEMADLEKEGYSLGVIGFSDSEIDRLLGKEVTELEPGADPDSAPAPSKQIVTREGDLWVLGRHRLLCGDSTSVTDLERLMDGDLAECMWTDPPYNVAVDGIAGKIENDDMGDDEFYEFLSGFYTAAWGVLKPGGAVYVAHAETERLNFTQAFIEAGFKLSGNLIWRKNQFTLSRSDYQWQHEPILYGWKEGASHRWYGGRNKRSVLELDGAPFEQIADNRFQIVVGERTYIVTGTDVEVEERVGDMLFEEKPTRNSDHPTMKPVALIERMLVNSTIRNDLVLDPFGGSGSTLIACERLQRSARLMELDPKFCDVIIKRWQEYTGKEAINQLTGETFAQLQFLHRK